MTNHRAPSRLRAASPSRPVALISVNVGAPAFLGNHRGKPVQSGIHKRPLDGETVWLDALNLAGDRQADQVHHGGPDKAVYAYPSEHLPRWTEELAPDQPYGPGAFGENLSVGGWLEDEVRIGDVWSWGDALLQVAQPRYPCFKLGIATGRPSVIKRLVANGRTGWYLRVLHPGRVPLAGPITVAERHRAAITVLQAHQARVLEIHLDTMAAVAAVDALADSWRRGILERLPRELTASG